MFVSESKNKCCILNPCSVSSPIQMLFTHFMIKIFLWPLEKLVCALWITIWTCAYSHKYPFRSEIILFPIKQRGEAAVPVRQWELQSYVPFDCIQCLRYTALAIGESGQRCQIDNFISASKFAPEGLPLIVWSISACIAGEIVISLC